MLIILTPVHQNVTFLGNMGITGVLFKKGTYWIGEGSDPMTGVL